MNQLLQNPIVMGPLGGTVAALLHFVNKKVVKKEEKVDMVECLKIFVFVAALVGGGLYFVQKKKLLGSKMLGGGSSASVPNQLSGNVVNELASKVANANQGQATGSPTVQVGRSPQTISSMPQSADVNLELSDINDVIHTGTPNF